MSAKMRDMRFRRAGLKEKSHPGQRRATLRKRANQALNLARLEKEARELGITVLQLRSRKAHEVADEQRRARLAAERAAVEREANRSRYGYYRY